MRLKKNRPVAVKALYAADLGRDIDSFGKTMIEALLGTTEPVSEEWEVVPAEYRDELRRVLERCIIKAPARRHAGFEPIAETLRLLNPAVRAALKDPFHPARPRQPGDKVELILPGNVEMWFAWCPPTVTGQPFFTGSEQGHDNERPVRRVTVSKGFDMGITPVTQAQWAAATNGDAPGHFNGQKRPVE